MTLSPLNKRQFLPPALGALLFLVLLPIRVQSEPPQECRLHVGDAWVSIQFPERWETDNSDGTDSQWYSGYTPDRTVWFSATTLVSPTEEQLKTWLPKHLESFGVSAHLDWTTFHSARGRMGTWDVTEYFATGQIEEGPCEVTVCLFNLTEKARLVVTVGGSPADRKKHRAMIEGIFATIKRSTPP